MAKLDKEERDKLKDSDFGIPSKRAYPIHDKAHVEAAVKLFGHASNEDKPELAHNILRKAKEFGMDSSGWTQVNLWAKKYKGSSTNENAKGITEGFFDRFKKKPASELSDDEYFDKIRTKTTLATNLFDEFKRTYSSEKYQNLLELSKTNKISFSSPTGNIFNIELLTAKEINEYCWDDSEMEEMFGFQFAAGMGSADDISFGIGIKDGSILMNGEKIANNISDFLKKLKKSENVTESFYVAIGEDRLYNMEDFIAYFEGTEYLDASADKTLYFSESDYLENNPFSSLLEEHYWDDITNTIIDDNGRIFDAGIFGDTTVQNTLNAFFKENTDIDICLFKEDVACVCIGDIVLESEMDFDDFFCEYGIEIFTETARPYDEYLRRHQYDPKSNTLIVDGERISAGRVGSKKERNRINHFLIRHKYDPETETIETGYPDPANPTQPMRVQFRIDHASDTNPENFRAGYSPRELERDIGISRKRISNAASQNASSNLGTGRITMQPSTMMSKPIDSETTMGHEGGHSYIREIEKATSPKRKMASELYKKLEILKRQRAQIYKYIRAMTDKKDALLQSDQRYIQLRKKLQEISIEWNKLYDELVIKQGMSYDDFCNLPQVKSFKNESDMITEELIKIEKEILPELIELKKKYTEIDDTIQNLDDTSRELRKESRSDPHDLATNEEMKKRNIPNYAAAGDYINSRTPGTFNSHDSYPEELTVDAMGDEVSKKYLRHPSKKSPMADSNSQMSNRDIQQTETLRKRLSQRELGPYEDPDDIENYLSTLKDKNDLAISSSHARNQFVQQAYERRLQQQEANNSARRQAVIQQIQQQLQNPSLNKQQRDRLNRKLQRLMAYENGYQSRIATTTAPPVQANGGQIQYNPSAIPQDAAAMVGSIQPQTKKQSSAKKSTQKKPESTKKSDDEKKPTAKKQESPKSEEKKPEASKPKESSKKSEEKPKDESKK